MTLKELKKIWLQLKDTEKNGEKMSYWYSPVTKEEYQLCIKECLEIKEGSK